MTDQRQLAAVVEQEGTIVIPADVTRSLGLHAGDAVSIVISIEDVSEGGSITDESSIARLYGSVPPLGRNMSIQDLRAAFEQDVAENAAHEGRVSNGAGQ